VAVFGALGGNPTPDQARRADFDGVNDLLERVEDEVKADFSIGVIGIVDEAAGEADDVAAMWNVRAARGGVDTCRGALPGDAPLLRDAFFDRLDGLRGLVGRGLLVPASIGAVSQTRSGSPA
jgi:uncharacterized protein DUF5995